MREVVGNRQARALIERAVLAGTVGHAYLLTGPEQIGKTTLALAFAQLLECEGRAAGEAEACGRCAACRKVEHGNHPDVALVEPPDGKRWLPVESVREVVRAANLAPYEGRRRVFVLPRAERMLAAAMNALLKTLEEPPEGVVLLLTSADPEALLPTLVSRCQQVPMHVLTPAEVARALRERWGVDAAEAEELAALAGGRLGWAVAAHERPELRERRDALLRQVVALAGATRDARMRLVAPLAGDVEGARAAVEAWTLWWRDVLLASLRAPDLATAGEARAAAERVGREVDAGRAEAFLRELLAAHRRLDQNVNPRLLLEVLALDMPGGPTVGGAARG